MSRNMTQASPPPFPLYAFLFPTGQEVITLGYFLRVITKPLLLFSPNFPQGIYSEKVVVNTKLSSVSRMPLMVQGPGLTCFVPMPSYNKPES